MLEPIIGRYRGRGTALYFRAYAPFAKPEIYELREAEGIRYTIRSPASQVLQRNPPVNAAGRAAAATDLGCQFQGRRSARWRAR